MLAHRASELGPRFRGTSALGIVGWSKVRTLAQSRPPRGISSASMHRIDPAERRRRIGARHALAARRPKDDLARLADDMAGTPATHPAAVFMEPPARAPDPTPAAVPPAPYVHP